MEEKVEDIYNKENLEDLEENDEISEAEEGFMQGYEGDEEGEKCSTCGEVLKDDVVEREIEGTIHRFCCEHCADNFKNEDTSSR